MASALTAGDAQVRELSLLQHNAAGGGVQLEAGGWAQGLAQHLTGAGREPAAAAGASRQGSGGRACGSGGSARGDSHSVVVELPQQPARAAQH
jgi:hypothetical protein